MNDPFQSPPVPGAPSDFDNPPEPNSPSSSTQATAASSVARLTDFEVSSSTLSDLPGSSSSSGLIADPATSATPACSSSQEISDPVVSRPNFSIGVVAASAQSSSNDLEPEDIVVDVPFEPSNTQNSERVPNFDDLVSSSTSTSASSRQQPRSFELPNALDSLEPEPPKPVFKEKNPGEPSSSQHPSDPVKPPAVNQEILRQVLELGFEEYIAEVAIRRTGGIGVEQAVNWIIDHSNESDIEDEDDDMGANESAPASSNASDFGALLRLAIPRTHKMVFVANMSLKMGVGKLAAQVGHATLGVYRTAIKTPEGQAAIEAWNRHGAVKIVVKGQSTEHLLDLFKQAKDLNLYSYVVQDAGYTQIPPGSRTILGVFGPQEVVDQVTGSLKLL